MWFALLRLLSCKEGIYSMEWPPCMKQFTNFIVKKLNGVILKIDFEKAYDKVKWSFLQQTLRMKGFSDEWRTLIHSFVSGGSVAIKVNDDTEFYFWTKKGYDKAIHYHPCYFTLWLIC
jgi:hypothetical protein